MAKDIIIGSGIVFPITLNTEGRVPIYNNVELIRSSILIIINWVKDSRFFNEEFGCRLEEVLEEPNDLHSISIARMFIKEALEKWEKRITIDIRDIDIMSAGTNIDIQIKYLIKASNEEDTFIFPYYRNIKN